ncbi:RING finger protein 17 [Genypterus blacodes]|uniref:RING finger protein 17 n=1 Tax=Genypterus blacodes TaxID=154954 RepID=UPI003F7609F2
MFWMKLWSRLEKIWLCWKMSDRSRRILVSGLSGQVDREKTRLKMEINRTAAALEAQGCLSPLSAQQCRISNRKWSRHLSRDAFPVRSRPCCRSGYSLQNAGSPVEVTEEPQTKASLRPPSFPVSQWVVVSHIVNPAHFYIRYLAKQNERKTLTRKIRVLSSREESRFTVTDTVEIGTLVLVQLKEEIWGRAKVLKVSGKVSVRSGRACPAAQMTSVKVFIMDQGDVKVLCFLSEEEEEYSPESLLKAVNVQMRKVNPIAVTELSRFAPQAVRCSLKDVVPYDEVKGWCKESYEGFRRVLGSAAVEMKPLGQDRDALLVDLRKTPVDQSSNPPISVQEYLISINAAKFYCPMASHRKPKLYNPAASPAINTELSAVVSHIYHPTHFYIRLVDDVEYLLLTAALQDYYNRADEDVHVYCPVTGQACVAQSDDELWYRAQVIGFVADRMVEVLYVDVGNRKVLSVCELRKMKEDFFVLPVMAICCFLSAVLPLDGEVWTEACTRRFISLAHQQLVTIIVTGVLPTAKPLPVQLLHSDTSRPPADIAELLVKEGLASYRKERCISSDIFPLQVEDGSAMWDAPLSASAGVNPLLPQTSRGEKEEFQLQLPACLKDLKVRVCHVNSPGSFYVRLSRNDSQLKRLCELLKQQYEGSEPRSESWSSDRFCAAHVNGLWERGRICSIAVDDTAEVFCCDYGNKMKLHISELRPLQPSLVGSLTLECLLTGIRPAGGAASWTATACDFTSYSLTGAEATMTAEELTAERPFPVSLSCLNSVGQLVSVADILTNEGLALRHTKPRELDVVKPEQDNSHSPSDPPLPRSPATSSLAPKPAPRTKLSAQKVKTALYRHPEFLCLGGVKALICAVRDDGVIFCRTQDAERQLQRLQVHINQTMSTWPTPQLYTWSSVQGCVVIGADMEWNRGEILEVLNGYLTVCYVDHGWVETIPAGHVYPMMLCDEIPQLCMPCKLIAICPVGGQWQSDAVALLKEMMAQRSVLLHVMELPADPRGSVTADVFLDGLSLGVILCHFKHAIRDESLTAPQGHFGTSGVLFLDDWDIDTEGLQEPEGRILGPFIGPSLPLVGDQFEVKVKHLLTPNKLFLWPLEGSTDECVDAQSLDEALDNMDVEALLPPHSFPPGGPCLAEYCDGAFYRAKLINFTSLEPITMMVQHVDFGSYDTLPPSKLRQMPVELMRFPVQALKVHVRGFKPPRVNQQGAVLPYSPSWSLNALQEMVQLLHGRVSALVLDCEPQLAVLLFDEEHHLIHLPLVSSGLAELD